MNHHQKRKRRRARSRSPPQLQFPWLASNVGSSSEEATSQRESLFIEAYEADVLPSRETTAILLEAPRPGASIQPEKGARASGLVKWDGTTEGMDVWVDRYDARLLLSSLPDFRQGQEDLGSNHHPPSPTGWSDLPSDTEDTFFLDAREVEEVRREKRRRLLDETRSERLRALQATDPEEAPEEVWGDDTEEPDDVQKELMRRTASHLLASPNPIQLEARILANHGADRRFAFLRGRWRNAWTDIKNEIRVENLRKKQEEEESKRKGVVGTGGGSGLTGLVNYGESDDQDSEVEKDSNVEGISIAVDDARESSPDGDDEAKKGARRARAKEWAAKRRAEKAAGQTLN